MTTIRIATRESELALWQAKHVQQALLEHHEGLRVDLVPMTTRGDRVLDRPLAAIGGKGLFLKELEQAMLEDRADIAVHSLKDVPAELPAGLVLPVFLKRANPMDALVSGRHDGLDALPPGAVVGTSSLRRRCLLSNARPDLDIRDLRGNVNTRLAKLDAGRYDAIVLACAGLERLGFHDRIRETLLPPRWLPAPGQGIIGIECREGDQRVLELLSPLDDPEAAICATAERALAFRLEAGCHVPLGGFARLEDGRLELTAMLGMPDASRLIRQSGGGSPEQAHALGLEVAESILSDGGRGILEAIEPSPESGQADSAMPDGNNDR